MRPYQRINVKNVAALLLICAAGLAFAVVINSDRHQSAARSTSAFTQETTPNVTKTTALPEGDLLQIQIPHDPLGLGINEVQTCWVWRDAKLQTASLSCPAPATLAEIQPR